MSEQPDLCLEELRRHDNDRYLTVLFAPAKAREALAALYAFNLEIARTAEVVSEPMLGQLRLQWWRETIEGIYEGKIRAHYVSEPLARAIEEGDLQRKAFECLIDGREKDLEGFTPQNLTELEDYLFETAVPLVESAGVIVDSTVGANAETARAVATAYGLIGVVRSHPFHVRRGRCLLPLELLRSQGLTKDSALKGETSDQLQAVSQNLVARSEELLAGARGELSRLPKSARSPYFLGTLAKLEAKRLRKVNYDPFDPWVLQPSPARIWRLLWASLSGRIV